MKVRLYLLAAALLLASFFASSQTQKVYANSVCTQNPPACVMTWITYSWTADCNCVTNPYTGIRTCQTCQYWDTQLRCVIPQAGGGSCQCCFNDGCYLNCPGVPPTSGGGNNNNNPTSTPVPNPTATPTPAPGTITAVAREVTTDTTCNAVSNSTTPVTGTQFGFAAGSANQPAPKTQTTNTPVTFANQPAGSYTIDYTPPTAEWVLAAACIYQNGVLTAYGNTESLTSGATVDWRFGFTKGTSWAQASGGDVYASASLRSYIPPAVSPRVFNTNGTGGYPGLAIYGTSYDFDSDIYSQGGTLASSKNWLVNANRTDVDFYNYFYHRFGSPTATDNLLFPSLSAVSKPASRSTPYYVSGDMTTTGDWTVGSGEQVVFLVEGNLTIGGEIHTTGTGFVAFIVHGNITVADTVGAAYNANPATSDVLDGVYVATTAAKGGTFDTGYSIAAGTAKLVAKGMFVADNFLLHRDLSAYNANTTYPAEIFLYDPRLLIAMPQGMQDVPVTWQEVAP